MSQLSFSSASPSAVPAEDPYRSLVDVGIWRLTYSDPKYPLLQNAMIDIGYKFVRLHGYWDNRFFDSKWLGCYADLEYGHRVPHAQTFSPGGKISIALRYVQPTHILIIKEFVSNDGILWNEWKAFSTTPPCTMRLVFTDNVLLSRIPLPPPAQSTADLPVPGPPAGVPPIPRMPSRPAPGGELTQAVLEQHDATYPALGGGFAVSSSTCETVVCTEWQWLNL